jgi:3-oxoacid CoA-transferase subunit A/glutaconate CoA-transferase subunit A
MEFIEEGRGELLGWMHPDDARAWMAEHKSRGLDDKRMTMAEAVHRFTRDGDYFAMGGFGHIRFSMAAIHEMIRRGRRRMAIAGKTAVHDVDVLIAGGVVDRVDCAYAFGHELRGLSPTGRRAAESGRVRVVGELSNASFQWRFKAAAMGLPWLPARVMLGTDTLRYSSSKVVKDPWTGLPLTLLPACYPDVAFIHVHRCDRYGNSQIDGTTIEDLDLARAAKRLVITAERIVGEDEIRAHPDRTAIPYFLVDAVVEAPYGSHPGNMPGLYYSDEDHMAEWLYMTRSEEGVQEYLDKYVYGVSEFSEYIELVGGEEKMRHLERLERLEVPFEAPWARRA